MGHGLFWFLAGAGAATWWSKHQSMRQQYPYRGPETTQPMNQHYPPWGYTTDREWEEQRARFRAMKAESEFIDHQMIEVSEATLDALLVAVTALREKLAEHQTLRAGQTAATTGQGAPQPAQGTQSPSKE
ncbi:hypothetical protein ONZ45_g13339 [Pleurotus djamor]|nr:hypothetical protein ONZ45_g13339 [Pleurotus djamor]